ncbi:MAG: transposase [Thermoplasmata archaeon]|nr:transposase [Thermoplasmata archaeon]
MTDILALLQCIAPLISKTTLRQLSLVVLGMLMMTGRTTMLGISRWTDKGGSYRTIQRLYHTKISWADVLWTVFQKWLWDPREEYLLAGDEVVCGKAGKETFGLDRFFSSIQQRPIAGLAFFAFSLINIQKEKSYPVKVTQIVRSDEEKAASKAKKQAKKDKKVGEKRKRGRPKGSQSKKSTEVVLNTELQRIQVALKALLLLMGKVLPLKYLVMDGHFGNFPSASMVIQTGLQLITKLRQDAALYFPYEGTQPHTKYGDKVIVRKMDARYLKESTTEKNIRTDIYQTKLLNKEFALPLNVVIILKTNLDTQAQAHVILFSTDLELAYDKLIKFYSLRFQIEFNFRDAKQYWGLEDFMNVEETAVTNAANLAFFMVNLSQILLRRFQQTNPDFSILDLKAHFHGYRYAVETIKMLPEKPDAILLADIFQQITRLGMIHPALEPSVST